MIVGGSSDITYDSLVTRNSGASGQGASVVAAPPVAAQNPALALMQKLGCVACHSVDKKIVGPSFVDVARKYPGRADYLAGKIRSGGSGLWGPIPMPPQDVPQADIKVLADWLAEGAGN